MGAGYSSLDLQFVYGGIKKTENDLQIDHQTIDCYVITLTSEIRKLRTHYATNPLNIGMYVNFPCPAKTLAIIFTLSCLTQGKETGLSRFDD